MYLTIEHGDFPAIAVETGHIPVRIQSLMVGMTIPYTERSDQDIFTLQQMRREKGGKYWGYYYWTMVKVQRIHSVNPY